MSTDEVFALRPFNDRPMPISRIIGGFRGNDFFCAYLSCGHSRVIEDGDEGMLALGGEVICNRCHENPPIVPVGSA